MKNNYQLKNNKKMKTQITKTFMAIALLAAGFVANATEKNREIELTTVKQKAVVLQMQNIEEGTTISLRSESGALLFEDKAEGNEYGKVFNLQEMEEGKFTLELESAESLEILPIEVTKEAAEMDKSASIYISKPVVKHNGELLKVYLGKKCLDMQMTIFDEYGKVAHRSQIEKGDAKVQRYDISDLADGNYKVQFTADGRSFYHTIALD